MDAHFQNRPHSERITRKAPGTHSANADVLLIQRKETAQLYTDEVLRRAGFWVRAVTPTEASFEDGQKYALVVFSNTLSACDASEIGTEFRRRSPRTRLLLLLGPDSHGVNQGLFDTVLEGLEGPAALVRVARCLADSSLDDAQGISA
jgi:hypothetical protein